jgi:hypothetical protein
MASETLRRFNWTGDHAVFGGVAAGRLATHFFIESDYRLRSRQIRAPRKTGLAGCGRVDIRHTVDDFLWTVRLCCPHAENIVFGIVVVMFLASAGVVYFILNGDDPTGTA